MIVIAAIDLRGGRVVQLVGGRPEEERVSLTDPAAVARGWEDSGFAALHVVDLDAALGTGSNRAAIESILMAARVPVQVGGGVREDATAEALIDLGVERVVVGTRAVEEPGWLAALAGRHPGRIVVAVDVRGDVVVTRGWTAETDLDAATFLMRLDPLPLAGVLITDVGREGRMTGADAPKFGRLAAATRHPVQAAGGIAGIEDLRALAASGVAAAVLGMALYTGAVDARAITREFAA